MILHPSSCARLLNLRLSISQKPLPTGGSFAGSLARFVLNIASTDYDIPAPTDTENQFPTTTTPPLSFAVESPAFLSPAPISVRPSFTIPLIVGTPEAVSVDNITILNSFAESSLKMIVIVR